MSALIGALGGLGEAGLQIGAANQKAWLEQDEDERKQAAVLAREQALLRMKSDMETTRQNAALTGSAGGATAPAASSAGGSAGPAPLIGQAAPVEISAADIPGLAKKYNIPEAALRNDLAYNNGKGIAEMIYKSAQPDIQIVDGVAIDKKKQPTGFVPGITTSADGRTTLRKIGPDGEPIVSVPNGAADAYGTYKGIEAGTKAATTPIKVYNPETKRDEYRTEADVIRPSGQKPAGTPPKAGDSDRAAIWSDELAKKQEMLANPKEFMSPRELKDDPDGSKFIARVQNDIASIRKEADAAKVSLNGTQGPGQSGRLAAGPSATEAAVAKFNDKMATEQGDVITASHKAAQTAANDIIGVQQARKAIDSGAFQGSGAEQKLAIVKFINANLPGITIDKDKASNTDYLKSILGEGLLEKAKTLGSNPSNTDAKRINDIVGAIDKDPGAMSKILDWRQQMAERAIALHNARVDQAAQNGFQSMFDMHVQLPPPIDQPKPVSANPALDSLEAEMRRRGLIK